MEKIQEKPAVILNEEMLAKDIKGFFNTPFLEKVYDGILKRLRSGDIEGAKKIIRDKSNIDISEANGQTISLNQDNVSLIIDTIEQFTQSEYYNKKNLPTRQPTIKELQKELEELKKIKKELKKKNQPDTKTVDGVYTTPETDETTSETESEDTSENNNLEIDYSLTPRQISQYKINQKITPSIEYTIRQKITNNIPLTNDEEYIYGINKIFFDEKINLYKEKNKVTSNDKILHGLVDGLIEEEKQELKFQNQLKQYGELLAQNTDIYSALSNSTTTSLDGIQNIGIQTLNPSKNEFLLKQQYTYPKEKRKKLKNWFSGLKKLSGFNIFKNMDTPTLPLKTPDTPTTSSREQHLQRIKDRQEKESQANMHNTLALEDSKEIKQAQAFYFSELKKLLENPNVRETIKKILSKPEVTLLTHGKTIREPKQYVDKITGNPIEIMPDTDMNTVDLVTVIPQADLDGIMSSYILTEFMGVQAKLQEFATQETVGSIDADINFDIQEDRTSGKGTALNKPIFRIENGKLFFDNHSKDELKLSTAAIIDFVAREVGVGNYASETPEEKSYKERLIKFTNAYDNMEMRDLGGRGYIQNQWPNTMLGIQDRLMQTGGFGVLMEYFKEGHSHNEQIPEEWLDKKVGNKTIRELVRETQIGVKNSFNGLRNSENAMERKDIPNYSPLTGKTVISVMKDKPKYNENEVIKYKQVAHAVGYDTTISIFPVTTDNPFGGAFISSPNRDMHQTLLKIKAIYPEARIVRDSMIFIKPTSEIFDEKKLIEILELTRNTYEFPDPNMSNRAKIDMLKNMAFSKRDALSTLEDKIKEIKDDEKSFEEFKETLEEKNKATKEKDDLEIQHDKIIDEEIKRLYSEIEQNNKDLAARTEERNKQRTQLFAEAIIEGEDTKENVFKLIPENLKNGVEEKLKELGYKEQDAKKEQKGWVTYEDKKINIKDIGQIDFTGFTMQGTKAEQHPTYLGNGIIEHFDKEFVEKNLYNINGQYLFNHSGRVFVLAKVGNIPIPFYFSSSGTSGKAVDWHYVFGIDSKSDWIIKGNVDDKGEVIYNKQLSDRYPKAIARLEEIKNEIRKKMPLTDIQKNRIIASLMDTRVFDIKKVFKDINVVEDKTPDGIVTNENYTYLLNAVLGSTGLDRK